MSVLVAGIVFFTVMFAVVGFATVIQLIDRHVHHRVMRRIARSRFITELAQGN